MVLVELGRTADVDAVADLWVELAESQRDFGSHLLASTNRAHVQEAVARSAVASELLVAREGDADGTEEEGKDGSREPDAERDEADEEGHGQDEEGHEDDTERRQRDQDRVEFEENSDDGPRGDSGDVVGFLTFTMDSGTLDQDATRGVVQNIYVVPEARSAGIGSALLAEAERRLAAAGVAVIALEVMAENDAARRFYRRHGYGPHRVELEKSVESDTLTKE
jgi:ribosomal protein S18 acetylase RimI-like enzyme